MAEVTDSLALHLCGLRLDGNKLFAAKEWQKAIDVYSRCIVECNEAVDGGEKTDFAERESSSRVEQNGDVKCERLGVEQNGYEKSQPATVRNTLQLTLSNRAESFLRLKMYKRALLDAEKALEMEADNVKSLNRQGKALEGLQQYEKAFQSFSAAHKLAPQDHDIEKAMKRTKICVQQTQKGDYNLSEFYLKECKGSLDPCCDYVGPVQISKVKNCGRGLIVTKDVVAGELLFVSNSLAMAFVLPEPSLLHQGLHYQSDRHEDEHLISKLAEVARKNPKAKQQLYSLAHENSHLEMEIPSMELFRAGGEYELGESDEAANGTEAEVDIIRIWGVAHYGAFNLYGHTADISEYYDSLKARRRGLWPLASFVNHSCYPNCLRMHIGNAMFVRAARHIPAGEELTLTYFGVLDSLETRQESAREWGFQCKCVRCVFEQSIAPLERIGKIFNELIRVRPSWQEDDENGGRPQISPEDLASLFNGVEDVIKSRMNLQPEQKHWIIASCIYAYVAQAATVKNDPKRKIRVLRDLMDSITSVSAANVWGLEYACDLLREVGILHGRRSEEYVKIEKRVIGIFRIAYGVQSSRKALMNLIQYFNESVGSVHSCDRC